MARAVFLAAAMMAMSSGAWAEFRSGDNLIRDCRQPDASVGASACFGYVMGIVDAMLANADDPVIKSLLASVLNPSGHTGFGYLHSFHACGPASATVGQLRAVVVKYLEAHPENWHLGASTLVAAALREAFPCPKQ